MPEEKSRFAAIVSKVKEKFQEIAGKFSKGMAISLAIVVVAVIGIVVCNTASTIIEGVVDEKRVLSSDQFVSMVENGDVTSANYYAGSQKIICKTRTSDSEYTVVWNTQASQSLSKLMEEHPSVKYTAVPSKSTYVLEHAITFFSFLLAVGILAFIASSTRKYRKASDEDGFGSDDKKKNDEAAIQEVSEVDVSFADVAGCDEAKKEVAEIVDFLKHPEKYSKLGAKIPHGIIMAGSPGTGKTLLAKATAGESDARFFQAAGSQFDEMYVGVGPKRVRELFEKAKANAPAIIFIDEIDAMGRKRTNTPNGSGESDKTLNQLLVCMDGFSASDDVIVMAATNRIDTLDPALLRPGRFDRHVEVELPSKIGRHQILEVHLRNKPVSEEVNLDYLSTITAGMSGAELANLANEAAIYAARRSSETIEEEDFEKAFERIVAGTERKDRVLSPREKRTTAYHEVGHALVGYILPGTDKVSKISIISRGRALGYTLTLPEDDKFLQTREELENQLAMLYGGIVAEEMVNEGNTSTGPSNDLERAVKIARAMVTQYGMSKLGKRALAASDDNMKPWSDACGEDIDNEIARILDDAHDYAMSIIEQYRDRFEMTAAVLYDREVIEGEEMEQLLAGTWEGTWSSIANVDELEEHEKNEEPEEFVPLSKAHEPSKLPDIDLSEGGEDVPDKENLFDKAKKKLHKKKDDKQTASPEQVE